MSQDSDQVPVTICFCYAREDEELLKRLQKHLKPLQKSKLVVDLWYDRNISPGVDWKREIDSHLDRAQIILLLISPDFIDSDYCYGIDMQRAMERHKRGEARVIPVILRPAYWQPLPLSELQVLPNDAKPVISSAWRSQDEAFQNITEGIHRVIKELAQRPRVSASTLPRNVPSEPERVKPAVEKVHFTLARTLEGHSRLIRAVTLSGDGDIVASASDDGSVKVWGTVNGRLLHTLNGHSGVVLSVSLSSNGSILASGGEDGGLSYGMPQQERYSIRLKVIPAWCMRWRSARTGKH